MRRYVGFLVSLVLSLAIVGAIFALAPKPTIEEDRDSLARAARELADYPFTPLSSDLRVFSGSWTKWVDEIDAAAVKKKNGGYGDPDRMVETYTPIFRKGQSKIESHLVVLAGATLLGPIVFWLGLLLGLKVFPKVEHIRYVAGRVALLTLAVIVGGLALPCLAAEDITGLAFSVPTVIGGFVGWFAIRKRQAVSASGV